MTYYNTAIRPSGHNLSDMNLNICLHLNADCDLERVTLQNEPEMARRISRGIEKSIMILESWILRCGGSVVQSGGVDFQAQVPAEHLDELMDILKQVQEACESSCAAGVGAEPAEALTALTVARKRGGDPAVVLYTPEIAREADENGDGELDPILDSETDALEGDETEQVPMQKKQFGDQPSPGEASKIASGHWSASHAEPSAPSPVSPGPTPSPGDQQPQQGGGLLQAVGQVLMDVKQKLPQLEQMKQTNLPAYDSVMALIQAVVAMAQKLAGGAQPVQKAEVDES